MIEQQVLRRPRKGPLVHPFREFAKVTHRGCSRILRRRIVDFSAERSFSQSALALREHYHIEVPRYCIDKVTAEVCREAKAHNSQKPESVVDAEVLISQTDGSMLPIITTELPEGTEEKDRRKHRKCHWKEIRVSTVSDPTLAESSYAVALGEPFTIGCMMHEICQFSGMTPQTHIHAVSDGAPWIAEQYELHFGTQCRFYLDFFHACDYLVEAVHSSSMDLEERNHWLEKCKNLLRESRGEEVIDALGKLTPKPEKEAKQTIAKAMKYLEKREKKGQLDYGKALEKDLPIGSGEVESAHRHLLQKRLKIAGAWWRLERAEEMAQLRAMRANHRWDEFWEQKAA
jgi:hypothetical protein